MSDIRYFGNYDENGDYKAFFPTDIHPDTGSMDTPNIELTKEQWIEARQTRCRVIDGIHTVVPLTTEEQNERDLQNIRRERNELLDKSDWVVLPHSPITGSKLDDWLQYRQDLRDVTSQTPPYTLPTQPE
jgi:hypothetical protein